MNLAPPAGLDSDYAREPEGFWEVISRGPKGFTGIC